MNRKIHPLHQSIQQMYCQRVEHIRSEKRDVTRLKRYRYNSTGIEISRADVSLYNI